jgi:hypothetical protein
MPYKETKIRVLEHRKTGLLMAVADDLPGFVVHAHTEDELEGKLADAYEQFMKANGEEVGRVEVIRKSVADYWPPAFIARSQLAAAA